MNGNAAIAAVTQFRKRFGKTLEAIYGRADLFEDPVFYAVSLRIPELGQRNRLRVQLAQERTRLEKAPSSWKRLGLTEFLERVYAANGARAERDLKRAFRLGMEDVGDTLLDAQEQMNVLEYETEIARNRRAKDPVPPPPVTVLSEVPRIHGSIFYRFDAEFWTDELEDLRVVIEPRCEQDAPR